MFGVKLGQKLVWNTRLAAKIQLGVDKDLLALCAARESKKVVLIASVMHEMCVAVKEIRRVFHFSQQRRLDGPSELRIESESMIQYFLNCKSGERVA